VGAVRAWDERLRRYARARASPDARTRLACYSSVRANRASEASTGESPPHGVNRYVTLQAVVRVARIATVLSGGGAVQEHDS